MIVLLASLSCFGLHQAAAGAAVIHDAVRAKGLPVGSGPLASHRVGTQVSTSGGRRGPPVRIDVVWELSGFRYRAVMSTQQPDSSESVVVNDGQTVWIKDDGGVRRQDKKTGQEDDHITEVATLVGIRGISGVRYARLPDSGEAGKRCRVVRVTAPGMPDATLHFDAKTNLLSKIEAYTIGADGVRRSEVSTYWGYKRVAGATVFMGTKQDIGDGAEVTETLFDTVEFVPLANYPDAFKKP